MHRTMLSEAARPAGLERRELAGHDGGLLQLSKVSRINIITTIILLLMLHHIHIALYYVVLHSITILLEGPDLFCQT